MPKNIVLGNEYDNELRIRLVEKLKSMRGIPLSCDWSMAGSQELDSMSVSIRGETIIIEAETFVGLSISGPDALVDEIAFLFFSR